MNRPSDRSFGLSVGAISLAIGVVNWWRGHDRTALVLSVAGALLLLGGLLAPALLSGVHRLWWKLAGVLGWINSRILLTILFLGVFTPVGMVLRLLRRDALRFERRDSSWEPYSTRRQDARHYQRLF